MTKIKIINGIVYEDDNFICEFQLSYRHDYNDLCVVRDKVKKKEYGCSYYKKERLNEWLNQYGFELEELDNDDK